MNSNTPTEIFIAGIWYELTPKASTHTPVSKSSHVSEGEKKDWEVLAFKVSDTGGFFTREADGRFRVHNEQYEYRTADVLVKDGYPIHSVKRTSDGEVFSIGDEVCWGVDENYIRKILSFKMNKDLLFEYRPNPASENTSFVSFSGAYKLHKAPAVPVKEVLFVTQDGKNIYDGDEYWYIYPQWIVAQVVNAHGIMNGAIATFSTKEAAEEYVIEHKPCLSLTEVMEVRAAYSDRSGLMEKLKQIIQQRLNK